MYDAMSGERAVWKGALSGVVGGLVASLAMNRFQAGLSNLSPPRAQSDDDATMKAAEAVSETLVGRQLTTQQKRTAGPFVHYAFGTTVGAIYGAAAELAPRSSVGWGLPFGAAVWLGADEIGVPMLGLSKPPVAYPISTHASALAAHLVYGFTAEAVRRGVRAAL